MIAKLLLHPAISHAQAEQVCREHDLEVAQDGRGNLSLRHRQKLEAARERFGRPFAHQIGTDWKPRATPVLQEWIAGRVRDDGPEAA